VAYRKLEVGDVVKVSNFGHNIHGHFGKVDKVIGDMAYVRAEWFNQKNLLLSTMVIDEHNRIRYPYVDYQHVEGWEREEDDDFDQEEYKGNLLERIVKLEQEVLDLKRQLA